MRACSDGSDIRGRSTTRPNKLSRKRAVVGGHGGLMYLFRLTQNVSNCLVMTSCHASAKNDCCCFLNLKKWLLLLPPRKRSYAVPAQETAHSTTGKVHLNATPFQKMPLLGKDHLARGRGDIQLFNQVAYTCADLTVQYTSYRLLFSDFGPWCASIFVKYLGITAPSALLDTPLGEARPLQAYLLLGGIALYFAKTLFWNWKFSHSNTLSVFAIFLVGIWYYYVLIFSIVLSSYLVNRMPSPVEIALAIIIEPLSLMHELLVDYELTEFKRTKAKGELLDYGYHSACRHPNYFFNFFPLGAIGLLSGSPAVGLAWFCIQVFWAYNQSGPTLEEYMKQNYGRSWREYCKRVPFVWPKPYRLANMLAFKYVGDKKQKIQATGKMSMIGMDKSMLKTLQKEAAEAMETIAED